MNTIGKRYGILAVCSALLIALDQWAKSMAYSTLRVNGTLVLIKGVLSFYTRKTGERLSGSSRENSGFSSWWLRPL